MKSSDILLSLDNEYLEVHKNCFGNVCVEYKGAEVKDGYFLKTCWGVGENFEDACDDYLTQIRGKKLVFDACSINRREVSILG